METGKGQDFSRNFPGFAPDLWLHYASMRKSMTQNLKFNFQSLLGWLNWLYPLSFKVNWRCVIGNFLLVIACTTTLAPAWAESTQQTWQSLWKTFDPLSSKQIDSVERSEVANALFELSENESLETLNAAAQLEKLGKYFDENNQPIKALPLKKRTLHIIENIQGSEHPETLRALNNLATTYRHLNAPDKALPLLQRVISAFEKTHGMETSAAAQVLNNLSIIYGELGQPDQMLPLATQALAIREKIHGTNHPDVAESMGNLADMYSELGQNEKAIELDLKAVSILEKIFGAMHPKTALSLNNLGVHYSLISQFELALNCELKAYRIYSQTLGPVHPETALAMSNMAYIYFALGDIENALQLNLRALEVREKIFGQYHPMTAISLNNLAGTYGHTGQFEKAIELQTQAIAALEAANVGADQARTAFAMFNMAGFLEKLGQSPAAIVWGKKGVNIYQSIRAKVAELGQISLTAYTESVESHYQDLANALTVQGRLAEAQQVLDMLKEDEQFELIRRSALDDPRRTRVGYTSTEQRWVMRYDEISHHLAELGNEDRELKRAAKQGNLSLTQRQRQQTLAADLVVARKAFITYTAELQSFYSARGPAGMDEKEETSLRAQRELQNLIGSLADSSGSGVALVQYFMTGEQVSILLTTPGVQLTRNSKVKTEDLNHMVADFRRQLRDPKSQPLAASQALYQLLVAPIAKDLQQAGAQTVMLSLNGALRYLPFAALHDGKQYLAQRWSLPIYTSVVRDRLRDAVHTNWQAVGLGVTRAVADFPALPSVRAEIRSIVKTDAQATGVLPGEVYLDDAFSAARLKAVGHSSFELLHVASHFRFSPGTEVNSYLLLGDGQRLTLGDIRTQNYRFDQVDLLTLSACETGLGGGRDEKGREIEGFGVIAQQQGAKAVLATLWPVADSSTADLMTDMYRRRQNLGLNKAEALRQAQVAMLQGKYAHPFYWAPFILMGNWK